MNDHVYTTLYENVQNTFDFIPPEVVDMYIYMQNMDLSTSSCIPGINIRMCKSALDAIPSKFRHLFATSLFSAKFPTAWTCAFVTLIPKSGEKRNVGNWRPISQTNIVHGQLLSFLQNNDILSEFQFGFLPEKSTYEAVFNVLRHMYSTVNNNKLMGVLFLDIAKAFNCINHLLLFKKMREAGMSHRVITWFRLYLAQTQCVKYGDVISTSMNVENGIAQGTVLGPLIFIFYINDCVNILDKVKITMFADDCILYYSSNSWNQIQTVLQRELDNFVAWTIRNNLRLNESKTQAMIVGSRTNCQKIKIASRSVYMTKMSNLLNNIII